jgi:peptidoglycan lytic transglycosylase
MRLNCNKTTLLALFAMVAWAAITASAFAQGGASSGGSSAPVTPPGPNRAPNIHPTGIATWFGPGFYGQRTACGQMLTPEIVGVAHRTLPCGTLVKVSYNGHTLTLPVLDRGPYSRIGADWDLTAGAALELGMSDTARIATRVVGRAPNTPALGAPPGSVAAALSGGAFAG